MTRNITLRLDETLIRKAKVRAAQQATSLSRLLTKQLEKALKDEDTYEASRRRALALLEQGFHLGGQRPASRDAWHERIEEPHPRRSALRPSRGV